MHRDDDGDLEGRHARNGLSPFSQWASRWMELARYQGDEVPDVDERLESVVALWNEDIPPGWERGEDERLLNPLERYCRGNSGPDGRRTGEHVVEYEILGPAPDEQPTTCFGARLIDGVNAVPLAKDPDGRRAGNVEADMLLLARSHDDWRVFLVEVKTRSNNAWYAAVENLRQLALCLRSPAAQALFHSRCSQVTLPEALRTTAIVLAEPDFYTAPGARSRAVAPAQKLLSRMCEEVGVDAALATWNASNREIAPLAAV